LPDSLRFWKTRIEERDADATFAVGLIYGPSGCGKSSLVKAGLLPRLSDAVIAVYVEASAGETEQRLLHGLRKRCPGLAEAQGLKEALASLRRGPDAQGGKKVLIVLDQFEQWLHARREEHNTELVQALRQCDGRRVQCIVMVRDDFWMAATRFMRDLEVRLLEGENSAAVDLFPLRHAEKVLAAFGRAFGVLPDNPGDTSKDQKQFLEQAVAGLAQDGKVISVRLALFAEMMKGRAWTPASLKAVGGTEGVGVTFLEETFSAATAPPEHRYHQKAARADLTILLPETGSDIKGHMRSYAELLEASGYGNRPRDFDDLLRILDNEIRLITPIDPEGKDDDLLARRASEGVPSLARRANADSRYYQLTHDYLVHSIREWLTRKQKETRRGRAELLLADRAAVWNARPENRQLPSLVQWFTIRWWTQKKTWTAPQQKMMARAGKVHALRGLALGLLLAVAAGTGLVIRERVVEQRQATHAAGLIRRLLDADTAQVPGIVGELADYRNLTDPLLREEYGKAADRSRQKLHASLALLPVDGSQVTYLYDRLLDAEPHEFPVISDALAAHKDDLLENLWAVALNPESGGVGRPAPSARQRAAAALAQYDPESDRWAKCSPLVANHLVRENPVYLGQWTEAFRPVKKSLIVPLADIFRDRTPERASERTLATNLLADYAADEPQILADLLMDADDEQFAVIYAKFKHWGEQGPTFLTSEIDKRPVPVTMDWTVRFYRWEKAGESKPPADWEAVLKSPVLKELRMARLRFSGEAESPPPPADNVPSTYFAVLATTELMLGESEYILTVTYDDGIRVWLDGNQVFENWGVNPPMTSSVTLTGQRGRHSLKVEFIQIEGGYVLDVGLDVQEKLAKRQANAAVALLRMNQPAKVWPLLAHSPDPRVRSYLTHRLSSLGADAGAILKQLDLESDVTIRRALILSLGEYGGTDLPPDARSALLPKMQEVYRTASDPGLHAASEWLLRRWKQGTWLTQVNEAWAKDRELREKRLEGIGRALAKDQEKTPPQWYVNTQGQTMVVIPGPVEFLIGSPPTEAGRYGNEPQYKTGTGRTFALSAKPVTVDEYRKFNPRYGIGEIALWARSDDCPVIGTNWFHAVAYCNWLSKQEGLPESEWCYEPFLDPKTWPLFAVRTVGLLSSPGGQGALLASTEMYPGRTDARYEAGMRLARNYLERQGYRLPTEAELEYATRAGALTSRYYGETDELLSKYAWYKQNAKDRTWPVGSLKPNDLGLFDVLGNVSVWCQDRYKDDPTDKEEEGAADQEGRSVVSGTVARVWRGGSFDDREAVIRSAFRIKGAPTGRTPGLGFRPARTFPRGR
jgi:formylglycine-generating enzyme required for sulfatase activity